MKKWILILTVSGLALCLAGCFRRKEETPSVENTPPETTFEATQTPQTDTEEQTGQTQGSEGLTGETIGNILLQDFVDQVNENPGLTAQEMADHLLSNPIVQFEGATMAVEEGLLTGFNNAEITGFEEGVMFAPMIGSIPFVGYVFTLPEGGDADAFIRLLTDNADPRWNICTQAEETITGQAENMVFFVMSPTQFE